MKRHEGMLFIVIGTSLCAAACGKGGGSSDWTSRPLKPITATVDGIAFTIDAPEGMRVTTEPDSLELDFLVGEYVRTPDIHVRSGGFPKTLDAYVKGMHKVDNWLRKDTLPDGYVVSYENYINKGNEDYLVYVHRTLGDKVLTCSGWVTPWERGATVKDKVPALEKICLSIKLAK